MAVGEQPSQTAVKTDSNTISAVRCRNKGMGQGTGSTRENHNSQDYEYGHFYGNGTPVTHGYDHHHCE